jgi:hypothetical protein
MDLSEQKKKLAKLETEFNIMKLETRLMEMDEEKIKIQESIEKQRQSLKEV